MRRAMRPAICTQVTSARSGVRDVQRAALVLERRLVERGIEECAGVIPRFFTSPVTGLRLECTLNTFMNTLIFNASRSR